MRERERESRRRRRYPMIQYKDLREVGWFKTKNWIRAPKKKKLENVWKIDKIECCCWTLRWCTLAPICLYISQPMIIPRPRDKKRIEKKERRWVSFIYIIFFSGDGIWSLRESKTRIKSREIYKFTKLSMKVRGETGHETSGDQHDDWNDL